MSEAGCIDLIEHMFDYEGHVWLPHSDPRAPEEGIPHVCTRFLRIRVQAGRGIASARAPACRGHCGAALAHAAAPPGGFSACGPAHASCPCRAPAGWGDARGRYLHGLRVVHIGLVCPRRGDTARELGGSVRLPGVVLRGRGSGLGSGRGRGNRRGHGRGRRRGAGCSYPCGGYSRPYGGSAFRGFRGGGRRRAGGERGAHRVRAPVGRPVAGDVDGCHRRGLRGRVLWAASGVGSGRGAYLCSVAPARGRIGGRGVAATGGGCTGEGALAAVVGPRAGVGASGRVRGGCREHPRVGAGGGTQARMHICGHRGACRTVSGA